MGRSILWFRQDLRLHDNEALTEAVVNSDELLPVFVLDPQQNRTGHRYKKFLIESLIELRSNLRDLGSDLIVRTGKAEDELYILARETKSHWIYCNRERTRDEVRTQDLLESNLWAIGRELRYSRGKMLYYTSDLPFPVTHCPDSFAAFRKETEFIIPVREPLPLPEYLPPIPKGIDPGPIPGYEPTMDLSPANVIHYFHGGETTGLNRMTEEPGIFQNDIVLGEGTHLSPWISMGCLSPKKVYHHSFELGAEGEVIRQNLFYRDYLRLMGKKYGDLIFHRSGVKRVRPVSKHDPELMKKWQTGNTGVDIIDAAMSQLNQIGWLPDVLRRLVANYYIKILNLDWWRGAAYFESTLIDYDPCSNWVSWLNLAGVGPDSREDRVVNFEQVGKKLDPDRKYIQTWLRDR